MYWRHVHLRFLYRPTDSPLYADPGLAAFLQAYTQEVDALLDMPSVRAALRCLVARRRGARVRRGRG